MEKKKDIIANIIFILLFICIYFILTNTEYIYGSVTDFKTQHYLIPEYFRNLFYTTHDLLPDFAFNLGGGQNIYYFSYYGLLNPIILLSYFFPFIKMMDYMIFTNCLIVLISTSLFYFYLKSNNYCFKTRFICSILFLLSGPLIFHSHRHVMFINYIPFLIMGLFGTDKYIKENKIGLLMASLILIIFTSYYYSVSSLVVLFIYYIYKLIKNGNKINKQLFNKILSIIPVYLIAILISSIIIIPTLYTLLNGRDGDINIIGIKDLITPSLSLLYDPYSIGLTFISLISILYLMMKGNKANNFLALICLLASLFPIFNYILNGMLYINSKSLIPFMPLCIILIAQFLNPLLIKKKSIKQILLILYLIISSFIICIYTNKEDKLMKKSDIDNTKYNSTINLINYITSTDKDIYRINNNVLDLNGANLVTNIREYKSTLYSSSYNSNYSKLYFDILNNSITHRNKLMTTSSNNIITQMLLGEKYIVTSSTLDLELIKEMNGIKLYKNSFVLPIGYASNNLIGYDEYDKLNYPDNVICMLKNIVVDGKYKTNIDSINKSNLNYDVISRNNIDISLKNNKYYIKAKKNASLNIKINENMDNKVLFIRFKNYNNPDYDISIDINGMKNKLTDKNWKYHNKNYIFDYVLYNTDTLNIKFSSGEYEIGNIETYLLDYSDIENINKNIDKFNIDYSSTKGDFIKGKINVTNDNSYFVLTIPYDKGFNIKVDGKDAIYENVNTSFIGFKIEKGSHDISIEYKAPYKNVSIIMSICGIIILVIFNLYRKKKKLKN